jgi:hypothetical protein
MALESPLKKDAEKAGREIDALNRAYNVYFQGGEDDPPRDQRKQLDGLIAKLKSQVAIATNASDKFLANAVVSRFQVISSKWDKHIRGIENGTIIRPSNRK